MSQGGFRSVRVLLQQGDHAGASCRSLPYVLKVSVLSGVAVVPLWQLTLYFTHSERRRGVAWAVVVVGASSAWAVDADHAGADQELRRQPHVYAGRQVSAAALPVSEGRRWSS